jgi:hypothetical protein
LAQARGGAGADAGGVGHGNGLGLGHGNDTGLGPGAGLGPGTHGSAPSFGTTGPLGFSKGNKTGWDEGTSPPGWSNTNGARTGWGQDATSPPGIPFR